MDLASETGEREACAQVGLARASFRRRHELVRSAPLDAVDPSDSCVHPTRQERRYEARKADRERRREERVRRPSSLALRVEERQAVLDSVHEPRFVDRSVPYIYATLLDEGIYQCSMSTMYRILHAVGEVGERRDQATRPAHVKPELCATAPQQVFAWDITKLHGPQKWTYFYLYAVIDIYSRYIVGWMVADRESSELARILLSETIAKERLDPSKLTVHSDRGSSMTSKPVAFLLADLGVTKSHSRPHVSDDNPHIESLFKTAKYQPEFPATFANIVEAREFCRVFVRWYNTQHRHSALALLTPADVHFGRAQHRLEGRQRIMDAAYAEHPERFVNGKPNVPQLPAASYINRPLEVIDKVCESMPMLSQDRDGTPVIASTNELLKRSA
ncbi:MAG: IS3 family transposase [Vulcanimicrobiaceae bacterium]